MAGSELAKLLRDGALQIGKMRAVSGPQPDAVQMATRLCEAAETLEALAAEPFDQKVTRATEAYALSFFGLSLETITQMHPARNDGEIMREYHDRLALAMAAALRAAGLDA